MWMKMRRESTRLSSRKEPMRKHGFLVMNCCVLLLLMAACLPPSAHAEEELWWAISFERTAGRKPAYGAAWNFKTREEAEIAAHKACGKKSSNPRNCEQVGDMGSGRMNNGECEVIVAHDQGYSTYGIYNNERQKAFARASRDDYGRPLRSKFELMICGK